MAFNLNGADFFEADFDDIPSNNPLLRYLQHQSPDVLARVAKSVTSDVRQIISHNVQGLVGLLPSENFNVQITTDRENLANLLASAMVTGYFLRQMEQRMELDNAISSVQSLMSQNPHMPEPSELPTREHSGEESSA